MTMPDLYPISDSNIVNEVCSVQNDMYGPTCFTGMTNGHVTQTTNHVEHTNGDVGHTNGHEEHTQGFVEQTMKSDAYTHNCVDHSNSNVHAMTNVYVPHKHGNTIDVSSGNLVKQTVQGRHVMSDTQPHDQHSNGATMYDLCEKLSSVGMDEYMGSNAMDQQIQTSSSFHDNIENEQSVFQWTHENVFSQDRDGDTCLHIAVIMQELNLVFTLINTALSHRSLSTRNNLSQTPLYLAALTNQIAAVRRLMVGGAEIDSRDRHGNTALHVACGNGSHDIAATLMEPVRYHETKMNTNYEIPYQKIPQNLEIANYEGKTVLHLAAENGHFDLVKMLIEKRADVNARDGKTGRTILHCACLEGNVEMVRYLLTCKECNLNARTYDDYAPFDFARIRGHTEIAIMLAHAGARNSEDDDFSE